MGSGYGWGWSETPPFPILLQAQVKSDDEAYYRTAEEEATKKKKKKRDPSQYNIIIEAAQYGFLDR